MRKIMRKIIVSMALISAFLANDVQSQAETKSWKVYHDQGAPSNAGVFLCEKSMSAGGTVALVKMTSYTNLTKTTIKTYRKGYKDACKYLNASKKEATLFVVKDQAETLVVSMSTTSGESTLAQGNFIR